MDAYEATRVVLSRIQSLDPDNAHKIMGLLLLQEHGEQEMIRLAFGPESLLQSVLLKARKELGLVPQSSAAGTSSAAPEVTASGRAASPFLLRQGSASCLLAATSPSSWAPPSVFSHSNSGISANGLSVSIDELQSSPELVRPSNLGASPFYGGSNPVDEFLIAPNSFATNPSVGDAIHPGIECQSPSGNANGMNWGTNGYRHRRTSSAADIFFGDSIAVLGWKPCLYFARGFCKNGTACRFLHGVPEEAGAAMAAGAKTDAVKQQFQDLLLRSKSQRIGGASHLMTSSFPCSPTGSVLRSPLSKSLNFCLQQQQIESQSYDRAAAALFLNSRMESSDLIANPGSRQIYLTFPADSTFTEEDVSDYFSIYGPVQDVRIPYQQKRMFGFVTFVFPETVKLIFAKGNPHFVCNSRVLVKPYKEKGKVPDKCRRQQPPPQEDAYDLQQLEAKTLYSNSSASQEILSRKFEEQRQASELQQAIELQGRRFMGLQLLDLHNRSFSSAPASINSPTFTTAQSISNVDSVSSSCTNSNRSEDTPTEEKSFVAAEPEEKANPNEDGHFQESTEHNLPDSSFASATKSSLFKLDVSLSNGEDTAADILNNNWNNNHTSTLMPITSSLGMPSFSSCFLHMPRSSFGHGAIGR